MSDYKFDPIKMAKVPGGYIADLIVRTPYDLSGDVPHRNEIFDTGLLLQAGLRALLPVGERSSYQPSFVDSGPQELQVAQRNYREIYNSGEVYITPKQKEAALNAISAAALQLREKGFTDFAKALDQYVYDREAPHRADAFHPVCAQRFPDPSIK